MGGDLKTAMAAFDIPALWETKIFKVKDGHSREEADILARESLLHLVINGKPAFQLLYLPGQEIELALGFLLGRGVIERSDDLKEIRLVPAGSEGGSPWSQVFLRLNKSFEPQRDLSLTTALSLTAGQTLTPLTAGQFQRPEPEPLAITGAQLLSLMQTLAQKQELFYQTGATHAVFLATATGTILAGAEDIGRHNAFDKVSGQALLKNLPTTTALALLSGRASFEMVYKAARLGVPLVCSVSAPTSLAVALAEAQGMTLVGFARDRRFNVYTHPRRLIDLP